MQVQIVTAATRQGVLEEARRRLGADPLVLSVKRRKDGAKVAWEAVVAKEGAAYASPEADVSDRWLEERPIPKAFDYESLREDLALLRGQLTAQRPPAPTSWG
ncbi:MAG: hypothetical protein HC923_05275 [Myxococcales bacterium]|nr:hypothetical protein [Myxococcales bacterium]